MADAWLRYSSIIALFIVAVVFRFWKPGKSGSLPTEGFFLQQKWDVGEAAVCLIVIEVLIRLFGSVFELRINALVRAGLQFGFHLIPFAVILLFLYYVRQPLSVVGLSRKQAVSLVIVGMKWTLWILALTWLAKSLWSAGTLLVERAKALGLHSIIEEYGVLGGAFSFFPIQLWLSLLAGILEEIEYRGLLYGALRKEVNVRPAMVISAFCFMLSHGEIDVVYFFGDALPPIYLRDIVR